MLKESKKKSAGKAVFLRPPGMRESWRTGRVQAVISSRPFTALTKQRANHCHPKSFYPLFRKYERPWPGSDFKRGIGRPHTKARWLPEPFPAAHLAPRLTKASLRWHNETHRSFQLTCEVWHPRPSRVTCWHSGLCEKSRPDSPDGNPRPLLCSRPHPPFFWTLAAEGSIKAPLVL